MLQNPCKTFGFNKNMVYKISPGGGKPYPASGLVGGDVLFAKIKKRICGLLLLIENIFGVWRYSSGNSNYFTPK